jgi:hypothetical protein
MLTSTSSGQIAGYGTVGWVAVTLTTLAALWVGRVKAAADKAPVPAAAELGTESLGEA